MRRALLWTPPIVYAALIFHFSSETNPLPEVRAVVWDKALHATEYTGLAFLLCRALRGSGFGWPSAIVLALILASVYAATDEWHQSFVAGRDSDMHDWLADTIGAVFGSGMFAGGRLMISRLLNTSSRTHG